MPPDDRVDADSARTRWSYDLVARRYAERFSSELDHKPLDSELLDRLGARLSGTGLVVDLGSGPGQIGARLAAAGARVVAVDISAGMLDEARRLRPGTAVVQADMRAMPFRPDSLAGVVAFYSLIHVAPPDRPATLAGLARALRPGGVLCLAVHLGEGAVHVEEMLDQGDVSLDFHFFDSAALVAGVTDAGLAVEDVVERDPYPAGVEADTRRVYVTAVRP